ncbi:MAG TPA: catalase-related domain-containing protein [Streptosporangiaceae bacterium]|nr:catalase-related domain-containing protein [Streptosporangiaceae bacterium]
MTDRPVTTTDAGMPAPSDEFSQSAGTNGPLLLLGQPRALWENVLTDTDREHLVTNIVAHIRGGVSAETLSRVIEYWASVHPDLGAGISKQVNGG